MIYEAKPFNKVCDRCDVDQTGYVNLVDSYANNSIDGDLNEIEERFNKIDDPASILGKPSDVFEAAHMRESLSNYTPPSNNSGGDVE